MVAKISCWGEVWGEGEEGTEFEVEFERGEYSEILHNEEEGERVVRGGEFWDDVGSIGMKEELLDEIS